MTHSQKPQGHPARVGVDFIKYKIISHPFDHLKNKNL
ncbi:hypothetical protein BN1195_02004 [Chryseobacterium oranimense G311]|nr:hypothetical protein BN1195_02004 [Chryseobacterium oranimense G311]